MQHSMISLMYCCPWEALLAGQQQYQCHRPAADPLEQQPLLKHQHEQHLYWLKWPSGQCLVLEVSDE